MQLETLSHVGAGTPPSELPPDDAPLEVVPPDDAPLDAPLDAPEEEPAPEELEAPLPDDVPAQGELQLCSVHWTKPLQFGLVQLEATMHMVSADEQLLLTQVLHIVLSVMPVTTETKASGLLHPPARPLDPPLLPEAPPSQPVPPPPLEEHPTAELNEPAITAVHTTALVIPASSTSHIKLDESR
jgi:hypothetical protein